MFGIYWISWIWEFLSFNILENSQGILENITFPLFFLTYPQKVLFYVSQSFSFYSPGLLILLSYSFFLALSKDLPIHLFNLHLWLSVTYRDFSFCCFFILKPSCLLIFNFRLFYVLMSRSSILFFTKLADMYRGSISLSCFWFLLLYL